MWLKTLLPAFLLATTTAAKSGHHGHKHVHHDHESSTHAAKYEYVVIGSGPGGGPLAARLALAGHKVLLIEAGPDHNGYNETVPARNLQASEDPAIAFSYFVTHYKDLKRQAKDPKMTYRRKDGSFYVGKHPPAGAEPLGILYPRTGALGGCAQHNAVVTVYPFASDWTYIQTLTGDDTWAPENMREYFKKLEDCQYAGAGGGHGTDGWFKTSLTELGLVVTDLRVVSIVVSAASALGKSDLVSTLLGTVTGLASLLLTDLNADTPERDQQEDLWQIPQGINRDTSKRSTPRDFILEVANARNSDGSRQYHLDIKLNTLATKIHFDKSGSKPRAIGVEYLSGEYLYGASPLSNKAHKGTKGYVAASKEVIVSAGTFNTPQLLKLSGIGPKKELKKFGIDVVKHLPGVGRNMQDRYEISIVGQTDDGRKLDISKACTFGYDGKDGDNDPCLKRWRTGTTPLGRGPYSTGGVAVGVTMKSSLAGEDEEPDLFVFGAPGQFAGYFPGFAFNATHPGNIWSWLTLKARSHNNAGTVTLRSKDPRDVPQIDFNSLDTGNTADGGNDVDLQALYEGLSFGREAFDKLIPLDGGFEEIKPGRDEVDGEDALKEYATNEAWGHHACCTAPIGADDDEMAVLDSKFRVRGVKGLRVVDATVFPKIPGTFISVPIYQISEKAADDIINGR